MSSGRRAPDWAPAPANELDRAGRDRLAERVSPAGGGEGKWRWSHERAEACERAIRELIADATRPDAARLEPRTASVLKVAHAILGEQPGASPPSTTRRASAGGGGGDGGGDALSTGAEASGEASRSGERVSNGRGAG